MDGSRRVREGMPVYGPDGELLGTVERVEDDEFEVKGRRYGSRHVARWEEHGLHLHDAASRQPRDAPDAGELRYTRREHGTVPAPATREHGDTHHAARAGTRPVATPSGAAPHADGLAFQAGTIRIRVWGEEAVVEKQAIVSGEVVVEKQRVVETWPHTTSVRKINVEVDRSEGAGIAPAGRDVTETATSAAAAARAVAAAGTEARDHEAAGELRVPVVEERLRVEKRSVEAGAVEIRRNVIEQQVTVPIEVAREEVRFRRVDTAERPIEPGERVFEAGTIRVPVRGEEAFFEKEAVVTGEVVIARRARQERQEIHETVRRVQVDVQENYRRARPRFQEHFNSRQRAVGEAAGSSGRTFEQAEPNYQAGFAAGAHPSFAGRRFEEVEPDLRRTWEARRTNPDARWEALRDEIREGFEGART